MKLVQCFEAETPVATDWGEAPVDIAAADPSARAGASTVWVGLAGGLLLVSVWPSSGRRAVSRRRWRPRNSEPNGDRRHVRV